MQLTPTTLDLVIFDPMATTIDEEPIGQATSVVGTTSKAVVGRRLQNENSKHQSVGRGGGGCGNNNFGASVEMDENEKRRPLRENYVAGHRGAGV